MRKYFPAWSTSQLAVASRLGAETFFSYESCFFVGENYVYDDFNGVLLKLFFHLGKIIFLIWTAPFGKLSNYLIIGNQSLMKLARMKLTRIDQNI